MSMTKITIVVFLSVLQFYYALGHTRRGNLTTQWVYVPDKHGNFYWLDLDTIPPQPHFDAQKDVKFLLYTRSNSNSPQVLRYNQIEDLRTSYYSKTRETKVICHGWFSDGDSEFSERIRKAYLKAGDYNVFVVDWGEGSKNIYYPTAAERTMDVGKTVANLFNFYHDKGYITSFNNITMVGHSLGAHIMGIAGKHLKSKAFEIYGLDPAGPLFYDNEPTKRLDKNDAQFTIGVRTDMDALGYSLPLAMKEFLPNGGLQQAGCFFGRGGFLKTCSHSRAWEFFEESLSKSNFIGAGCKNFEEIKKEICTKNGNIATLAPAIMWHTPGYFYFRTASYSPFGLGEHGRP